MKKENKSNNFVSLEQYKMKKFRKMVIRDLEKNHCLEVDNRGPRDKGIKK